LGIALALLSAVAFGLSDIAAGLAARRLHSAAVAFVGQLTGVGLTLVAALLVAAPEVTWTSLGWGALAGVGTGLREPVTRRLLVGLGLAGLTVVLISV
jgi:hypothetical protein